MTYTKKQSRSRRGRNRRNEIYIGGINLAKTREIKKQQAAATPEAVKTTLNKTSQVSKTQ